MMNIVYRIILVLLVAGFAACTSTQSSLTVAGDDEDRDIGLGGTGMLASTDGTGSGLGGTGILGKVTGFGSVFVNGIEIEYDDTTIYTIDGEAAGPQKIEIGDVVEVLTTDDKKHTRAQIINLRHEVVGLVESVDEKMFSFTVHGQSVIHAIHGVTPPEVGTTVAVSGFRIDEQNIIATRVMPAVSGQTLLRTQTDLPFKGKTDRWVIQTHVQDDKASFEIEGNVHTVAFETKVDKTLSDRLGIKIIKLLKTTSGKLDLDHVIDASTLPRGRQTLLPVKQPGSYVVPGTVPNSAPGLTPGVMQGTNPGVNQGAQPGTIQNLKR